MKLQNDLLKKQLEQQPDLIEMQGLRQLASKLIEDGDAYMDGNILRLTEKNK